MRIEIVLPDSGMPKKDPENPCPCQFRPFKIKDKTGELHWLVSVGDRVEKDQVICEAEIEKKTLEFTAPCAGIIDECCFEDEDEVGAGDVLGYILTEEE